MIRSWDVAQDLPAFDVRPVMRAERSKLLTVLRALDPSDWLRPTACPGWDVHDVALHLLANDLGRLAPEPPSDASAGKLDFLTLSRLIEAANEDWIRVARGIPPVVTVDFLAVTGRRTAVAFGELDLNAQGVAVGWTGTGPSPYWLDLAREYTERWMHHQQIREAVGAPILSERRWLHPVLDAFMRSLPRAYEDTAAESGTRIGVTIEGPAGGRWLLRRDQDRWRLVAPDGSRATAAEVSLGQDLAWRLLTRLISREEAAGSIRIRGDERLGASSMRAVAVMTTKP